MGSTPDLIAGRLQKPETSLMKRDYLVMEPLLDWLRQIAVQYASGRLLDYGCGNKPYYALFHDKVESYTGADLTQNIAQEVDIVLGNATRLPVEDASFSTVLSTQVFEHVAEPDQYLSEASRILRPGGHLILTCPGSYMLHEEPHDYFRYTIYGLKHLLDKHGFDAVRVDQAGGAWRLIGQTFLNQVAFGRRYKIPIVSDVAYYGWILFSNLFFAALDRINLNAKDTVNYMLIARKR